MPAPRASWPAPRGPRIVARRPPPAAPPAWLAGPVPATVPPLDLSALVTPIPTDRPGVMLLAVPDGLQQGRGAWGGVATGAMVAAAQACDDRPGLQVRTASAQLVAPLLVGTATVVVEVLRRGSATSTVAARVLDSSGALLAHGVVVLGSARRGDDMPGGPAWLGLEPPPELAAGPDAVAAVRIGPPLAPEFTAHLDFRPVTGLPYSASPPGPVAGWVAPRAPVARVDAAVVVALADAWWVTVMARMDRVRPAATVGFALDLPGDVAALARDRDGHLEPLFHRGRVVAAREGFVVETRELWTASGMLVSWNTQTVAVIA